MAAIFRSMMSASSGLFRYAAASRRRRCGCKRLIANFSFAALEVKDQPPRSKRQAAAAMPLSFAAFARFPIFAHELDAGESALSRLTLERFGYREGRLAYPFGTAEPLKRTR